MEVTAPEQNKPPTDVRIGTAGWSLPAASAPRFAAGSSHLARYATRLAGVEINTSFYRPHRPSTYARWAATVPPAFRFAVKVPKEITHVRRLVDGDDVLDRFLGEAGALGATLGPLLVQMPPSLEFAADIAGRFFTALRRRFTGAVVCEPRHPGWFEPGAERLLAEFEVARVAADPAPAAVPAALAGAPGGWSGLLYYRLHGSPTIYRSAYSPQYLDSLAAAITRATARGAPAWCIFDNTAEGAATADALGLQERLAAR